MSTDMSNNQSVCFVQRHVSGRGNVATITDRCVKLSGRFFKDSMPQTLNITHTLLQYYTTEVRPLSKAPNPQLLPGRRNVGCPLLQVCVHLDGLNAENTFHSLYSV